MTKPKTIFLAVAFVLATLLGSYLSGIISLLLFKQLIGKAELFSFFEYYQAYANNPSVIKKLNMAAIARFGAPFVGLLLLAFKLVEWWQTKPLQGSAFC